MIWAACPPRSADKLDFQGLGFRELGCWPFSRKRRKKHLALDGEEGGDQIAVRRGVGLSQLHQRAQRGSHDAGVSVAEGLPQLCSGFKV